MINTKKRDPSTTFLLRVIFLLSFLFLGYTIWGYAYTYDFNKKQVILYPYFDYGTIKNRVYHNNFFNFSIPVPKEYLSEHKTYQLKQINLIKQDTLPLEPVLVSQIDETTLLTLQPVFEKIALDEIFNYTDSTKLASTKLNRFLSYKNDEFKRKTWGADFGLNINIIRTPFSMPLNYSQKYINMYIPESEDERTKIISGVLFYAYEGVDRQTSFLSATKTKQLLSYACYINGFSFNIEIYYTTENQKCALLALIDQIHFKKEGPLQENEFYLAY